MEREFGRDVVAYRGKLSQWNDEKGFGFITPEDGGQRVFVHIKSFIDRRQRPVGGEDLSYALKLREGRIQADEVEMFGDDRAEAVPTAQGMRETPARSARSRSAPRPRPRLRPNYKGLLLPTFFMMAVAWTAYVGELPMAILWFYGISSVVTFMAYALDKSAARRGGWRTQESTLHLFALACGWPGAVFAQQILRHKSKKESFRDLFWITVVLNVGALGWLLFSASGRAFLAEALR